MKTSSTARQIVGKCLCVLAFVFCLLNSQSAKASILFERADPNQDWEQVDASDQHYLRYVRYMTVPLEFQSGEVWNRSDDITDKTAEQIGQIVSGIKALEDSIQRQIFEKMQSSTEDFGFHSTTHARNVVLQRMETMQMMRNFNNEQRYLYSRDNPTNPYHAQTSETDYWATGRQGTPDFMFRQINGTAYEAISALCADDAETYGECLGAMYACV